MILPISFYCMDEFTKARKHVHQKLAKKGAKTPAKKRVKKSPRK